MFIINVLIFAILANSTSGFLKDYKYLDICGFHNYRKLYVEYGTSGDLLADYRNRVFNSNVKYGNSISQKKCTVELITCPSCVIEIKFKYLNISRTCRKASPFAHCRCDYILLHEPPFENAGEQFCGRFIQNNVSEMTHVSRTRLTTVDFVFTNDYGHAFTLQFSAKRNQILFDGYPTVVRMNNASQIITSPFFPHLYPSDLSAEYVIQCHSKEPCRIRLIFTDFLMADSSILEFFDWNGQRMYVISGNIFRPPVIVTSGPSLVMRFYANGASDFGFKATYSFSVGSMDDSLLKPNIDCGGQVNNLGGGITMMNMTTDGTKFFDCVWIVKIPTNFLHRKTHLYVKVVNFTNFAGPTELILRQGVTSDEPTVETLKYPARQFKSRQEKEHIVPIEEGFYIRLKGWFKPESQVAIVYAAFNYKDCFSGLDFLCQNLRCISALLNCDGFDHCGDSSDESSECAQDPKDHRAFSKIPNFLFPKVEPYADLTTATFVFLLCTFGLIGIIFAMALLLYRVNLRARHHRQIQDHIETIHAILGEGVGSLEEEIIIPDEPPDYEPPPEYSEVLKYIRKVACGNKQRHKSLQSSTKPFISTSSLTSSSNSSLTSVSPDRSEMPSRRASASRSCQTTPSRLPESPPPAYDNVGDIGHSSSCSETKDFVETGNAACGSKTTSREIPSRSERHRLSLNGNIDENLSYLSKRVFIDFGMSLKENIRKSTIFIRNSMNRFSFSDEHLVRYFSDSHLIYKSNAIDCFECRNLKKRSYSTNDLFN